MVIFSWLRRMVKEEINLQKLNENQFSICLIQQIITILLEIDKKHFQSLSQISLQEYGNDQNTSVEGQSLQKYQMNLKENCFQKILERISDYFNVKQYKKMRKHFYKMITQSKSYQSLLDVLLYLCVTCPNNIKTIQIIFQMTQQEQNQLMNRVKYIEGNMENVVQMKKIVQKIQGLIQRRQALEQAYQQMKKQLQNKKKIHEQLEYQNQEIQLRNNQYQLLVTNSIKQTKTQNLTDFLELCIQIKKQNNYYTKLIEQSQNSNIEYDIQNELLKKQVFMKAKQITSKYQELQKLKENLRILKNESERNQHFNTSIPFIPPLSLQQKLKNKNMEHSNCDLKIHKTSTDRTNYSNHIQQLQYTQQNQNLGTLLQIQKLEKQKKKFLEFVNHLKHISYKNRVEYARNTKLLERVKNQHLNNIICYSNTKLIK